MNLYGEEVNSSFNDSEAMARMRSGQGTPLLSEHESIIESIDYGWSQIDIQQAV